MLSRHTGQKIHRTAQPPSDWGNGMRFPSRKACFSRFEDEMGYDWCPGFGRAVKGNAECVDAKKGMKSVR